MLCYAMLCYAMPPPALPHLTSPHLAAFHLPEGTSASQSRTGRRRVNKDKQSSGSGVSIFLPCFSLVFLLVRRLRIFSFFFLVDLVWGKVERGWEGRAL